MTAPIDANLRPNVDTTCFQRTKGFYGFEEEFSKIQLNFCLLPSIVIHLAV